MSLRLTEREETERALVGCVLLCPELASEIKVEWFDDLRLASLVMQAVRVYNEGIPVNMVTLVHRPHGVDDAKLLLEDCEAQCPSALNFEYWKKKAVSWYEKKRLKQAADRFTAKLPSANGDLSQIVAELETSLSLESDSSQSTLTSAQCATGLVDHLEQRMSLNGALSGIETGFTALDKLLDGLQFGEVTILASRPSIGKTAIACNIVQRACLKDKVPTLFLSLEMSASALCRRMLSALFSVKMNDLKSGKFTNDDFEKFAAFDSMLKESPMFIRESFGSMGASEAAAIIRRSSKKNGVRLVVLDYLQKVKADNKHEKKTYEVAEASAALVAAVRETKVAFLCLAQLNRESEKDKGRMARLSDLADSGQIERDADTVLLLHRDRAKPEAPAKLIIAKQRDGETGMVELQFNGEFCRFGNPAMPWEKP